MIVQFFQFGEDTKRGCSNPEKLFENPFWGISFKLMPVQDCQQPLSVKNFLLIKKNFYKHPFVILCCEKKILTA